jgi:hypothetical protein
MADSLQITRCKHVDIRYIAHFSCDSSCHLWSEPEPRRRNYRNFSLDLDLRTSGIGMNKLNRNDKYFSTYCTHTKPHKRKERIGTRIKKQGNLSLLNISTNPLRRTASPFFTPTLEGGDCSNSPPRNKHRYHCIGGCTEENNLLPLRESKLDSLVGQPIS